MLDSWAPNPWDFIIQTAEVAVAIEETMLDTRNRPGSNMWHRCQVINSLINFRSIPLDICHLCIAAFGKISRSSVRNAFELKYLNQAPRIVLRLQDKHLWFNKFVEISSLEAFDLRRILLSTGSKRHFGLAIHKFVGLDRIICHGLVVVNIGKINYKLSAVRYNKNSFRM